MRKLFLIGCCVLLPAISLAQKGNSDEETIKKLDADWSAAASSKDVDKSVSYYADDAAMLPNQAPIASGKAQIKEVWTHLLSLPGLELSFGPNRIEVSKSKDIAYEIGTYKMKFNDAQGNPTTEIGKFVVVWKKQADKQWKAVADIFNPDK
jgi:ketosteroid isomerase-like protein